MKPTIRVADERDWDAIAQLNHDTFALELGQYESNEAGRKTDRLHDTNRYIVAYVEDELVGMLSITLPSTAPFSTLKRLPSVSEEIRSNLYRTAEIRLLAIKPEHRGLGVFGQLMVLAIQTCYQHGVDRVLMSAIENKVALYELMGFRPVGEPVAEGTAVFIPMLITRQTLEAAPYGRKLARSVTQAMSHAA